MRYKVELIREIDAQKNKSCICSMHMKGGTKLQNHFDHCAMYGIPKDDVFYDAVIHKQGLEGYFTLKFLQSTFDRSKCLFG